MAVNDDVKEQLTLRPEIITWIFPLQVSTSSDKNQLNLANNWNIYMLRIKVSGFRNWWKQFEAKIIKKHVWSERAQDVNKDVIKICKDANRREPERGLERVDLSLSVPPPPCFCLFGHLPCNLWLWKRTGQKQIHHILRTDDTQHL